jgi:hypothetical protein
VADPTARASFDESSTPTGALQDPTLAVHTAADPLVLVQNQSFYRDLYLAAEDASADFVQAFTVAPNTFTLAPYGAGHCTFPTETRVGAIELMQAWVRDGVFPGNAALDSAFGEQGFEPNYTPPAWPLEDDGA